MAVLSNRDIEELRYVANRYDRHNQAITISAHVILELTDGGTMITTQQAAEIIGCGRRHINKLCAAGAIKSQRFGRVLQVDEQSVRAYAANEQARTPGPRRRLDEYGWPI